MNQSLLGRRLSIRTLVGVSLAVIMLATATLVYLTLRAVEESHSVQEQLAVTANQTVLLEDIRAEYLSSWLLIVSQREQLDDRFVMRFEQARARADWAFAVLLDNARALPAGDAARIDELAARHQELTRQWRPVVTMLVERDIEGGDAALNSGVVQASDAFVDELGSEVFRYRFRFNRALSAYRDSREIWQKSALLVGGLWVLLVAGAAYGAHRWLLRPLSQVARSARLVAAGELNSLSPIGGPTEVANLAGDVNLMALSLMSRSRELSEYLSKGLEARTQELEAANDALRTSEARLNAVIESAPVILFALDSSGVIMLSKGAGLLPTGLKPGAADGRSVRDLLASDPQMLSVFEAALNGETVSADLRVGDVCFEAQLAPLRDAEGRVSGVIGVGMDVTARKAAEDALRQHSLDLEALNQRLAAAHADLAASKSQLEEKSLQLEEALELERAQARVDPLTGALNHGAIVEELRRIVDEPAAGAVVVMLDIDGMKAANDVYGHPFGDQVLKAVKEALSRDGALVGRYGGDEFVAILRDGGRPEGEAYCRRVLNAIEESGLRDPQAGTEVPIVVSIGFCLFPEDAQRIEDLIALADSAMYAHKRQRPAHVVDANTRRMGGEPATRMLGEIVPALTSGGELKSRLAVVAEKIATEYAYSAVEILVNPARVLGLEVYAAYPRIQDDTVERRFIAARLSSARMRELLELTRRAIIIDAPDTDNRLVPAQREVLHTLGVRSAAVVPIFWEDLLIGFISAASDRRHTFGPQDGQLLMGIATQVAYLVAMPAALEQARRQAGALRSANAAGAYLLSLVADRHGGAPSHDFHRLRDVAAQLARELGLPQDNAEQIGIAAMLHDVGKYLVPPDILSRPHELTEDEWQVMRRHTIWGHELLSSHRAFDLAAQVARWHHERWDGRGYPDGLVADEIPLGAAIASVADALDAIVYDRVYREGKPASFALEELVAGSGRQFSPRVVDALVRLFEAGALSSLTERSGRLRAA